MNKAKPFLLIVSTLLLTACGGGGGSSSSDEGSVVAQDHEAAPASEPSAATARPDNAASGCTLTADQAEMLNQLNAIRAQGRQCGNAHFEPAPAVAYSCEIQPAANEHSIDMATNNYFSHTGSDGLRVSHRVTATGYEWSVVGENIAAGYGNVDSVMTGWLNSEGHCRNIMDPRFEVFAVARVNSSTADYDNYWTQVFAAER